MAMLTIDTYQAIQRLRASGMPSEQAQAVVETLQDINLEGMATKDDIAALKQDILEFKADLFKWLAPLFVGQIGIFTAIVGGMMAVFR
jgi:uncharacterized protein YoaH (UPF0181 family)